MKSPKVNTDIESSADVSKANSRRQFITKAAAGGVVATLASKTAWAGNFGGATGCSVSGNLSGNLSQAKDCSIDSVKGIDPITWHHILGNRHKRQQFNVSNSRWRDIFPHKQPFGLGNSSNTRIRDFLTRQSSKYSETNEALVVAYLNAVSGQYPLPSGVSAEAYVNDLYDAINVKFSEGQIVNAVRATY
ncbi:twin-arginine translocation signal domain-containing protein [Alteromonas sp. A081]|uniref:twin-arginine translocation signal domain-containing protein n=1 Tax=Alteromonas sp. A081 TaxID=3410269 RepID=UPI003B982F89